jgi:hypothetical protein
VGDYFGALRGLTRRSLKPRAQKNAQLNPTSGISDFGTINEWQRPRTLHKLDVIY